MMVTDTDIFCAQSTVWNIELFIRLLTYKPHDKFYIAEMEQCTEKMCEEFRWIDRELLSKFHLKDEEWKLGFLVTTLAVQLNLYDIEHYPSSDHKYCSWMQKHMYLDAMEAQQIAQKILTTFEQHKEQQ